MKMGNILKVTLLTALTWGGLAVTAGYAGADEHRVYSTAQSGTPSQGYGKYYSTSTAYHRTDGQGQDYQQVHYSHYRDNRKGHHSNNGRHGGHRGYPNKHGHNHHGYYKHHYYGPGWYSRPHRYSRPHWSKRHHGKRYWGDRHHYRSHRHSDGQVKFGIIWSYP